MSIKNRIEETEPGVAQSLWISALAGLAGVVALAGLTLFSYLSNVVAKSVITEHLWTLVIVAVAVFVAGFGVALRWTGLTAIQSGMKQSGLKHK